MYSAYESAICFCIYGRPMTSEEGGGIVAVILEVFSLFGGTLGSNTSLAGVSTSCISLLSVLLCIVPYSCERNKIKRVIQDDVTHKIRLRQWRMLLHCSQELHTSSTCTYSALGVSCDLVMLVETSTAYGFSFVLTCPKLLIGLPNACRSFP